MAVVEAPFDLVETKLEPPPIRPGTVAKTAVIGRLQASGRRVATVIAPAGYGKTTFLARWAEMDARPFAWVALDERDDDPAVFHWTTRVPRVVGALFARERPLVLVLEDLHLIENPACLDALAALLEYVPAGSQLAISSRCRRSQSRVGERRGLEGLYLGALSLRVGGWARARLVAPFP